MARSPMIALPQDAQGDRAMTTQATGPSAPRQDPFRWDRADAASAFAAFSDPFGRPASQRQFADDHGIPLSTLNYWLLRAGDVPDGVDPDLASFLRRPAGEAFLRRVVLALFL